MKVSLFVLIIAVFVLAGCASVRREIDEFRGVVLWADLPVY